MPSAPNIQPGPLTANEVKEIRSKLNLSQIDLAAHLGYSTGQIISHWESGRKVCDGPAAQLLRLFDNSGGKALRWSFVKFK